MSHLDWFQTKEQGHGRREIRTLHTQPIIPGEWDWPGLAQVCRLVSQVHRQGSWQVEVHYKITSLSPTQAGAKDLLELSRSHWGIENRLHYVRDVTFGEDASQIRTGEAPRVMVTIRNLVLNVLRRAGCNNIASGLRWFNWNPTQALVAFGLADDIDERR